MSLAPRSSATHTNYFSTMKMKSNIAALALSLLALPAAAGPGHDHDEEASAPNHAISSEPQVRASSSAKLFELVSVLQGRELTLYVDHVADNLPVHSATLTATLNGHPIGVKPHGEGEFHAELDTEPAAGPLALSVVVNSGGSSETLQVELSPPVLDAQGDAHAADGPRWKSPLAAFAAALGLSALIAFIFTRRRRMAAARLGASA